MDEILAEQSQRLDRRQRVSRKGWIRNDSDESELSQRAGRPPSIDAIGEPPVRDLVVFVRRPEQRRQDIDVKE
jgi:hypothetical protein